jgi:hypothetical protein
LLTHSSFRVVVRVVPPPLSWPPRGHLWVACGPHRGGRG